MANTSFDFGMIGLGVMGRNLLLNMADHGFSVVGFDKDPQKTVTLESSATTGTTVKGVELPCGDDTALAETPQTDDAGPRRQTGG